MQKSIFGLSSRPAVSNIRNLSSLMITAFISFPNKISTASFCQSFIMSVEISFLDLILGALSFMRAALQHRKLYIPPTSSSHPSSASSGPEGFDARSPFSSKSRQVCRRKSLQLIHHLCPTFLCHLNITIPKIRSFPASVFPLPYKMSRHVNEIWSISATCSAPSSYTQINLFIDYSLYNKILSTQAKPGAQFSLIIHLNINSKLSLELLPQQIIFLSNLTTPGNTSNKPLTLGPLFSLDFR